MAEGRVTFTEFDESAFQPARGAVMAFAGPAKKGPLRESVLLRSEPEMERVIGDEIDDYDVVANVRQAIREGARVRFGRSVQMTDPSDFATRISAAAEALIPVTVPAQPARQTTSTTADLEPSDDLTIDVNGSLEVVTFSASAAVRVSTAELYDITAVADLNGDAFLVVAIDGGAPQTLTVNVSQFAIPTAATAAEVAAALDAQISGAVVNVVGFSVRITSSVRGTASRVHVQSGSLNAALSFSTAAGDGTGNVPNIDAVTPEDLFDLLTASPEPGLTPSFSGGVLTLATVAVGADVYLGFDGVAAVALAFGWTAGIAGRTFGSDEANIDLLRVRAREEGTFADGVVVTVSAGVPSGTFTLTIGSPGLGISAETYQNITADNVATLSSSNWTVTNLFPALPPGVDDIPDTGSYVLDGGDDGTTGLTAANHLGSSIVGTGVFALRDSSDYIDVWVPGLTDNAQQLAMASYGVVAGALAYLSFPVDLTAQEALDFRRREGAFVGGTMVESSHATFTYGNVEYADASSASGETAFYDNAGLLAGITARNDTRRYTRQSVAGPWLSPAHRERGRALFALSVRDDVSKADQSVRDAFDENHVNWFQSESGSVLLKGNWTSAFANQLTSIKNVRRMLLALRRDLVPVAALAQGEPNDPVLWRSMYREFVKVLDRFVRDRALSQRRIECDQKARNADDAVLNTPDVVAAQRFRAQIFVRPIPAVKDVEIEVIVTSTSVEFVEVEL